MGKFYYTDVGKAFLRSLANGSFTREVAWNSWNVPNHEFSSESISDMQIRNLNHPLRNAGNGDYGIACPDVFNSAFGSHGSIRRIVGRTTITKTTYSNKSFSYVFTISNDGSEDITVKTLYFAGCYLNYGASYGGNACTWGYELDNAITIHAGDSETVTVQIKFE